MSETPAQPTDYFRLHSVRLYQPDAVLGERLVGGTARLAAFSQTLVWVGAQYFGGLRRDSGSLGIFIAVGVKPLDRTKFWCETVEGDIPADVWDPFVDLLRDAGANVRPQVTGPFAFALETVLGAGPTGHFPGVPREWTEAARALVEPVVIPDGLFHSVFPD